jgi:hypothetical protein
MDVADRELERMVERRSRNGETDPDEREELWKESVRAYNARREEERSARVEYHRGQAVRLRTVLAAYEVMWDALPHLRDAQEAGEVVRCEECGRRLTLGEA